MRIFAEFIQGRELLLRTAPESGPIHDSEKRRRPAGQQELIQRQFRYRALQLPVLIVPLLHPFHLTTIHAAVVHLPAVVVCSEIRTGPSNRGVCRQSRASSVGVPDDRLTLAVIASLVPGVMVHHLLKGTDYVIFV